jgi:phenylacetate-coenzyme A ligase PaaK-like adenylate-forming protein
MKLSAIFVLIFLTLTITGCVNVRFTAKDGTQVEYTRFLTNVDRIEGRVGDNKVTVGGSTVNVEALTELLKAVPK